MKALLNDFSDRTGTCIDITGSASLKAHNDGCPGGSEGGFLTLRQNSGEECLDKPDGTVSMLVVSA